MALETEGAARRHGAQRSAASGLPTGLTQTFQTQAGEKRGFLLWVVGGGVVTGLRLAVVGVGVPLIRF